LEQVLSRERGTLLGNLYQETLEILVDKKNYLYNNKVLLREKKDSLSALKDPNNMACESRRRLLQFNSEGFSV
jgi:hypothetical protein